MSYEPFLKGLCALCGLIVFTYARGQILEEVCHVN